MELQCSPFELSFEKDLNFNLNNLHHDRLGGQRASQLFITKCKAYIRFSSELARLVLLHQDLPRTPYE